MSKSDEMYADSIATADGETVMRERDSNARCYARAVLKGDKFAHLLLRRFEIAEAEVEARWPSRR